MGGQWGRKEGSGWRENEIKGEVLQIVGMEGREWEAWGREWEAWGERLDYNGVYALYNHLAPCSLLSRGCGDGLSWQGLGSVMLVCA